MEVQRGSITRSSHSSLVRSLIQLPSSSPLLIQIVSRVLHFSSTPSILSYSPLLQSELGKRLSPPPTFLQLLHLLTWAPIARLPGRLPDLQSCSDKQLQSISLGPTRPTDDPETPPHCHASPSALDWMVGCCCCSQGSVTQSYTFFNSTNTSQRKPSHLLNQPDGIDWTIQLAYQASADGFYKALCEEKMWNRSYHTSRRE